MKESKEITPAKQKTKRCYFVLSVVAFVWSSSCQHGWFPKCSQGVLLQQRPGQALPCCRAFLLGQAEASPCSEPSSRPCPHSSGEGHCVCRRWRNVLLALGELNTRGSSPKCFLRFSLQKRGQGRRGDKDKFFLRWTRVMQSST